MTAADAAGVFWSVLSFVYRLVACGLFLALFGAGLPAYAGDAGRETDGQVLRKRATELKGWLGVRCAEVLAAAAAPSPCKARVPVADRFIARAAVLPVRETVAPRARPLLAVIGQPAVPDGLVRLVV